MKPGLPKGSRRGADNPAWKGDAAQEGSKRHRAHYVIPKLGDCALCGAPARHRHHKDKDINNNEPANLIPLCVPCHRAQHPDVFGPHQKNPPPHRGPACNTQLCINCGQRMNDGWRGMCMTCYTYWFRHNKQTMRPIREGTWNRKPDALVDEAYALRASGMSYENIAKALHVGMTTVYRWLNPDRSYAQRPRP